VITPSGDPYTLLAMSVPMVLFYEGSIIVGRLLKR
jgi:Sec-independent protein secretion pathway component TatC